MGSVLLAFESTRTKIATDIRFRPQVTGVRAANNIYRLVGNSNRSAGRSNNIDHGCSPSRDDYRAISSAQKVLRPVLEEPPELRLRLYRPPHARLVHDAPKMNVILKRGQYLELHVRNKPFVELAALHLTEHRVRFFLRRLPASLNELHRTRWALIAGFVERNNPVRAAEDPDLQHVTRSCLDNEWRTLVSGLLPPDRQVLLAVASIRMFAAAAPP